jgi:hypothetical protein
MAPKSPNRAPNVVKIPELIPIQGDRGRKKRPGIPLVRSRTIAKETMTSDICYYLD